MESGVKNDDVCVDATSGSPWRRMMMMMMIQRPELEARPAGEDEMAAAIEVNGRAAAAGIGMCCWHFPSTPADPPRVAIAVEGW